MRNPRFEERAVAMLVIIMVALVGFQVLSRYVFHFSLSYTEEVVRYLFVWATFLGIAGAVRDGRHLSISSAPGRGSGFLRSVVRFLAGAGALVFSAALLVSGAKIVFLQASTGQKTAALGFPMWLVGLAVPVGAALLILRVVRRIFPGGGE